MKIHISEPKGKKKKKNTSESFIENFKMLNYQNPEKNIYLELQNILKQKVLSVWNILTLAILVPHIQTGLINNIVGLLDDILLSLIPHHKRLEWDQEYTPETVRKNLQHGTIESPPGREMF